MYVETRTSAAEVLAEVHIEVRAMSYRVINDASNRKAHPTYLTKPMQREHLWQLQGAHQLAWRVTGTDLPEDIEALYTRAVRTAIESLDND